MKLVCKDCGQEKVLSEFRGDKRLKHGVAYRCKECRRSIRSTNGEYLRERLRKYEKRSKMDFMTITTEQLKQFLKRRNCAYCGCDLTSVNTTVDHVYRLSDTYGGGNTVLNIAITCRSCNSSKQTKHVFNFYKTSEKFTDELWTKFVKDFTERLVHRKLNAAEVEQMKCNFESEAKMLEANCSNGTKKA